MSIKRIILVGLGPHARRIYYPFLEKHAKQHNIRILLVVDLQSQRDVLQKYLSQRTLQPEKLLLLKDTDRHSKETNHQRQQALREALGKGCDGMIIASEAQSHATYIQWALDHNLDILTDKPISAPLAVSTNVNSAEEIYNHYIQLERQLKQSTSNLIVQCQRRSHRGYQLIHDYLTEFLQTYQVPISYLNVYHADGMWPMPSEFFARENHPYKYGYGKLMHSGYHFVDLFAWLSHLNNTLAHKSPNNAEMFVQAFRPADLLHQIDQGDYRRLFGTNKFNHYFAPEYRQRATRLGELDAFVQCQLKREQSVVTTGSIDLQQNSFSRRAWSDEPADVYKGNGRVRHERINLQVGNLLNIQVHSYQSHEVGKDNGSRQIELEEGGHGHDAHFDIHIYRNSDLIHGNPYEKFAIGTEDWRRHQGDQTYLGHNEKARETLFLDFINGRPSDSHFSTHKTTNLMLAKIYRCMAQAFCNEVPYTQFPL